MKRTLHIYPCFDNILYFPIYLAIDLFRHRDAVHAGNPNGNLIIQAEGKGNGPRTWKFDDLDIVLEAPVGTGGDEQAIDRLIQHSLQPDHFAIAITDPMLAVKKTSEASSAHSLNLKIIGTFINRIALWSVMPTSLRRRGINKDLVNRLHTHWQNYGPPLGRDFTQFNKLRVVYCDKGFTTDYVLDFFLSPLNKKAVKEFGEAELMPLFRGDGDIAFTNVPWLNENLRKTHFPNEAHLDIRPYFPPVPFPFSSVVTTLEFLTQEKNITKGTKPIEAFIRHLFIAVSLSYRCQKTAIESLKKNKNHFRDFGLNYPTREIDDIIDAAVREMVKADCLSEDLSNSWISWDFAFEASTGKTGQRRWDDVRALWKKTEYPTILSEMNNDDEFLKRTLRRQMISIIDELGGRDTHPIPWTL